MFKIYNKYNLDHFEFEGYEVTILKYDKCLCRVNDMNSIKVNNDFMQLDYNTQQWILYHELGHIYYNHNNGSTRKNNIYHIKRKLYSKLGLVVKEEIQADLYAVKRLGKANALKGISRTISMFHRPKELITRRLIIKIFGE